jgi:D-ribulokinase
MSGPCFIGVDVGTGSVRAGVFDEQGGLLGYASRPLKLWKNGDHVEQSSADIWTKTCEAVREARTAADVAKERVVGIGFDATCSMVVVGKEGGPLPVGLSGEPARDVIVWMDHRALKETDDINATSHPVLSFVGGQISPEMETPKLLWLSRHAPETFAKAGHFFDLPDYLSFRATGDSARSNCTVVCKWTYLGHEKRWDRSYFEEIGLGQLADEEFDRIGPHVIDVATPIASGLTQSAAKELDLQAGTAVGASLIDAHSGGLGTLGAGGRDPATEMALIAGTSACTMTLSREPQT